MKHNRFCIRSLKIFTFLSPNDKPYCYIALIKSKSLWEERHPLFTHLQILVLFSTYNFLNSGLHMTHRCSVRVGWTYT